jgi:signal transduction histidine kinase
MARHATHGPGPTQAEGRFSLRLFAAFSLIALAFVASSVYANWLSVEIEGEANALTQDALPSAAHLTRATDALRDLEAATDDYADLAPEEREPARGRIAQLWRIVDGELAAYLALPAFSGERELYADVPGAMLDLQSSIDNLFVDTASGDREKARATADRVVRARANQAASLLRQLVTFNAAHASESSARIQATRHRVVVVAAVLDVVTVLFTGAIALWIWRIFRSFSRLQQAHAELQERRADELELFGRRVAHDLISPLSSLTFCLTAFKRPAESDPKLANALERAKQCVTRAQRLVDSVFEFARSGGAPRPDAAAPVREIVEQVADEARALDPADRPEVTVELAGDSAVRCTPGVLASILGNLVRNSVKFMRDSAERRIVIRSSEIGEMVRLEIADSGPGVPSGLEEAIFQPYVRGEGVTQPGLGLGLATVRRFCEAHGGSVRVASTSSRGSVFEVLLPRAPEGAAAGSVNSGPRLPASRGA